MGHTAVEIGFAGFFRKWSLNPLRSKKEGVWQELHLPVVEEEAEAQTEERKMKNEAEVQVKGACARWRSGCWNKLGTGIIPWIHLACSGTFHLITATTFERKSLQTSPLPALCL